MTKLNYFLLLLVLVSSSILFGAICGQDLQDEESEYAGTLNQSELHLSENHIFHLQNIHRPGAALKFSLVGSTINVSQIEHTRENIWRYNLTDKSDIFLGKSEAGNSSIYSFVWLGDKEAQLEVCLHLGYNNASWYATYEGNKRWPMDLNEVIPKGSSFTVGNLFGSVVEGLFLSTDGFAMHMYELDQWFVRRDPNHGEALLCMTTALNQPPYHSPKKTISRLDVKFLASKNIRTAHHQALVEPWWIPKLDAKQHPIPDEAMFKTPTWSTKVEFKKNVTQGKVLEFAAEIKKQGFPLGQIEIDDQWEQHYGDLVFDSVKFPNASAMIEELHKLGFKVNLWIHPFVNKDSAVYQDANNTQYFVKNRTTPHNPASITWWDGEGALVDFSNHTITEWFTHRLQSFRAHSKVDSFKFDAGELGWYGADVQFQDQISQESPNLMTFRYVLAAHQLGGAVEVRSAFRNQDLPLFVRLSSKESSWSSENGLRSLIRNALTLAIGGYSFILPDMIGGNESPTEELYIRWVQATVFLPAMQFSIPPWHFKNQSTIDLVKKFVNLRAEHMTTLITLAKRVSEFGEPLIRPLWYAAPDAAQAYSIDDQFMLGEDILVAPVLVQGQLERSVYLPSGDWLDQHGKLFTGPATVKVLAPLEELPFFKRKH